MRKIILIAAVLFASICEAQLSSIILRNDTLFSYNPSTGVWLQLTKTVPAKTGQSGKILSNNGTDYEWINPGVAASVLSDSTTAIRSWVNGNYSLSSHSHSGVYQPVGSYLVAADITGKANIASPTFTGTVTLPDNAVTNAMLAGSIAQSKITNYAGYTINVQALTSSPTDAQTVYFGTLPKAPVTAAATSKIYIRQAGTITGAELYCYSGTAGTNESWSLYVRVNNTTDYLIQTVAASASERVFSNTGLSIAVSSGDYIEIKSVQPTWATNPLTTIFGGYIRIN